jgi:hypothetical protein
MKRAVDAYRRPRQNRPRKYPRELVVAMRARWANRDTHKKLADELGIKPEDMNYFLNAPLNVICKDCESDKETHSQGMQTNGVSDAHP